MPRKIILKFRAVNRDTFLAIRSGKKKIETRVATEKYRDIKAGDTVILICGKSRFQRQVKAARYFTSIRALFRKYKIQDVMPDCSTLAAAERIYYNYPHYREKIKRFGLIVLELK